MDVNAKLIDPGPRNGPVHAKHGWRYDNAVTATMIEDMLFDPIMAAKVLLGARVPPHEELRILLMWTYYLTLDDSGFSTGKSYTYAIVSALRSILMPGRIGGIISGTFRQGKLIFANYDRWYLHNKIFRSTVKFSQGKAKLIHGAEVWEAYYRGGSTVRVLPPNFVQDATKLRSERWNDLYADEWPIFGNFKALTSTILGRVTQANKYGKCYVRQNHIHLAGTPGFTHQPAYKFVKQIQAIIDAGDEDHHRFTCNYRHIPKTSEWEDLVNRKVIFTMQTMNPPGIVQSEVDGEWTSDSLSYYNASLIESVKIRLRSVKICTQRTHMEDVFLGAFDTARGRSQKGNNTGDDFSLSVLRIPLSEGRKRPEFCFCIRKNNITAEQMAGIIHQYHKAFGFSMLAYDAQGGGMFVRDELRKHEQLIMNERVGVYPIVEMGDTTGTLGDMILIPFRRSTHQINLLWGKMGSDSVLVNRMHQNMRAGLGSNRIAFPLPWGGWDHLGAGKWDVDMKRLFLNKSSALEERDKIRAEIDLAVSQLVLVDVKRDEAGEPKVDKHGMYEFKSAFKKDSAYSLIYAYVLYLAFEHIGGAETQGGEGGGFQYSVEEITGR